MKNLYLIYKKGSNLTTRQLIAESASRKDINVISLVTEEFDFTPSLVTSKNDGLYNLSDDWASRTIEKLIINDEVKTFYKHPFNCYYKNHDVDDLTANLILSRSHLPIVESIPLINNDKKILKSNVDRLGGFPIIIKSLRGSHGVGVMKIDSWNSLCSVVDYLIIKDDNFLFKRYFDFKAHARIIVLNGKAISSIEYIRQGEDFRSNIGKAPQVKTRNFSDEVNKIAEKSVDSLGFEFGGVDILITSDDKPYIAEVNFPCFFPRAQNATGIDIASMMIEYLINK